MERKGDTGPATAEPVRIESANAGARKPARERPPSGKPKAPKADADRPAAAATAEPSAGVAVAASAAAPQPVANGSPPPGPDAGPSRAAPAPRPAPSTTEVATAVVDPEAFSKNVAKIVEEGGKALAAYLKPRETGAVKSEMADELVDVVKTLGQVAEYWMADPQRAVEAQTSLVKGYMDLWTSSLKRMTGEPAKPAIEADPRDQRFKDPEWSSNQFFDFLKQAYLITANWADHLVKDASGLDEHTRHKADFYMRQIANAISPSNFVLTNPEVLRETLASNADNLVRGMKMLAEDIEAGRGELKIRQSDLSRFEVGKNLATTPGKVIFQNDLMQLIQYSPTTEKVLKTPLLIVPPWINKFYILDLTPEKSFIKWCVDRGVTVFTLSWVNPDEHQAKKGFGDYVTEGPLAALDAIERATGETDVHAIGYCVGGTLLSVTLAYMAAVGDARIRSATLFTTQVDFTHAGDLKVFVDEEQIRMIEKKMAEFGYLSGRKMATAFNMLRSNDLIWPYVVNNYLKGKAPFPFDLLYWNADSTRMPAANHSFYLRNCYLENSLARGAMEVLGKTLDLQKVTTPIYNLAAREDHIAPAKSVFVGSGKFGGKVDYVVAGSGHIAGVINPPDKNKYQFWTGGPVKGAFEDWLAKATEHPGSWWPHWLDWIRSHGPEEVKARVPGGGKLAPIEDAPGSFVKVRD